MDMDSRLNSIGVVGNEWMAIARKSDSIKVPMGKYEFADCEAVERQ
jgi:hypothetical protein